MKFLVIGWAFAIGLLVPLQSIINAKLSRAVGGPTQGSLISFGGGFIIFLIIGIFNYKTLPSLSKLMSLPTYLYAGGFIGAIFVISAIMILPKLGSTGWTALIVTGQLIASLIMDHFGLFGLEQKSITIARIIGGLMLIAGSGLIIKY